VSEQLCDVGRGITLCYETFGDPSDPTALLVMGLGTQMVAWHADFCSELAARGLHVVRFDNRDIGRSTHLDGRPPTIPQLLLRSRRAAHYRLTDMAEDAVAVLDAIGVETAHVMGCSMGGMIVQRLAIEHPDRLRTVTSVMSRTGEPGSGDSSPEALAFLMAPPPDSRSDYMEHQVAALRVYGSKPEWLDEDLIRARAGAAYDRCFCPEGIARQMRALMKDGSRADQLAQVDLPVLVLHGSRDTLIDPSGGRRTAELIPGARYVEIEGMGHDYPPAVWRQWVEIWSDFARDARSTGR